MNKKIILSLSLLITPTMQPFTFIAWRGVGDFKPIGKIVMLAATVLKQFKLH